MPIYTYIDTQAFPRKIARKPEGNPFQVHPLRYSFKRRKHCRLPMLQASGILWLRRCLIVPFGDLTFCYGKLSIYSWFTWPIEPGDVPSFFCKRLREASSTGCCGSLIRSHLLCGVTNSLAVFKSNPINSNEHVIMIMTVNMILIITDSKYSLMIL